MGTAEGGRGGGVGAARSPGFSDGVRVVLSDGGTYCLPVPRARYVPGPSGPALHWTAGAGRPAPDLGRRLEGLAELFPGGADADALSAWNATLGTILLMHNHDLDPEQAVKLTSPSEFLERGDLLGFAAFLRAAFRAVEGAMADVKRARAALPPARPSGAGAVVGLN